MKGIYIALFILCFSLAAASRKSSNVNEEVSFYSEVFRGFVSGLRYDLEVSGPCLEVVPQMESTFHNMTLLYEFGDYWGVFFEIVDYSSEFVILIDKC
jgi:hypothetical protein